MFKTQDFEKLWYRYKSEGEPNGLSIERYCMMNGVPYRQFENDDGCTVFQVLSSGQLCDGTGWDAASVALQ